MKIEIEYEASWRNSFLDGSNDEPLPKKGRKFIGSITALKKQENYIVRDVTHNTVMGILNRLIGEQRKLYQARNDKNYFFKEIESLVTFEDDVKVKNSELVYLRNMSGNTDQNSFTGMINTNDSMFSSDYSVEFWGVLALDINELLVFIVDGKLPDKHLELDPLSIANRFAEIGKFKALEESQNILKALDVLGTNFEGTNYKNNKGLVVPLNLYCSSLYLQLERLKKKGYSFDGALTKAGTIPGISKRNFTKKDFMDRFTTGGKKIVYGNPYIQKLKVKGIGEVTSMLTKASGVLEITIDIPRDEAKVLKKMIENAGVSSFYLGKKGLAYVINIDTREVKK